ncbi:bifunctional DNA primase/polymerase [Nonomuraea sp. NPDC050202]|uniref:bifunctional DNA primase/polymerase n=1 Tax=Nonomuraea sp. NPDC050202 TaxID=3155035 RepID=UPI00340745F6
MHLLTPDPLPLVELGIAVFPLLPGGRLPARPGWQRDCLRTPGEVAERWPRGANLGIGCWANQLVILDLDVDDGVDGRCTLESWCERLGVEWPDTFTVATPSGGSHLYFRAPAGCTIGSISGGTTLLGQGIDTRGPGRGGRGGYVVGPGSIVNGKVYAIERDVPIAELPTWIADLLQ